MRTYDLIKNGNSLRRGMFEFSLDPNDGSLLKVRFVDSNFKEFVTTVPAGLRVEEIVRAIVTELYPDEDSEKFTYR